MTVGPFAAGEVVSARVDKIYTHVTATSFSYVNVTLAAGGDNGERVVHAVVAWNNVTRADDLACPALNAPDLAPFHLERLVVAKDMRTNLFEDICGSHVSGGDQEEEEEATLGGSGGGEGADFC